MKIGVLGYNTDTGLGRMSRSLIAHLGATRHLVPAHPMDLGTAWCDTTLRAPEWTPSPDLVDEFLTGLDAVVTVETDYGTHLADRARAHGVRSIFVPMWEWQGEPFLYPGDDVYACTSKIGYRKCPMFHKFYLPWPVELPSYRLCASPARLFLHNAGTGGMHGRKGTTEAVLGFLAADLPEGCRLRVRSQVPLAQLEPACQEAIRAHADRVEFLEGNVPEAELYVGDAYLYTARLDGQSMVAFEAAAAGVPTFVTDAAPMNELDLPPWAYLNCDLDVVRDFKGQKVATYRCTIPAVAKACEFAATHSLGTDMGRVRCLIEQGYSWMALESRWRQLCASH